MNTNFYFKQHKLLLYTFFNSLPMLVKHNSQWIYLKVVKMVFKTSKIQNKSKTRVIDVT